MSTQEREKATLLIEFVGAAGVGKSTLARKLYHALHLKGMPVSDFEAIAIKRHPFNVLHIARAIHLALLTRPRAASHLARAAKKIARYSTRQEIVRKAGGIYVCSDGMFHKLRLFYRRSRGLDMNQIAERVFTRISPPDIVVVVEACASTVYSRRLARNRHRDQYTRRSVQADVQLVDDSVKAIIHVQNSVDQKLRLIRVNAEHSDDSAIMERLVDTVETSFISLS